MKVESITIRPKTLHLGTMEGLHHTLSIKKCKWCLRRSRIRFKGSMDRGRKVMHRLWRLVPLIKDLVHLKLEVSIWCQKIRSIKDRKWGRHGHLLHHPQWLLPLNPKNTISSFPDNLQNMMRTITLHTNSTQARGKITIHQFSSLTRVKWKENRDMVAPLCSINQVLRIELKITILLTTRNQKTKCMSKYTRK